MSRRGVLKVSHKKCAQKARCNANGEGGGGGRGEGGGVQE